ncbi:MAG: DNA translocase FtsK [Candidatus Neomarinimicrobiota bacterium]|nr:DNA translocase FtsK [Candidatus Neomarinimicrobiota bacterium]
MSNRQKEFFGILVLILSVFIFLSFLTYSPFETPSGLSAEIARKNIMGIFGVYVSYYLMKFSFGWGTFFLPLILVFCGYAFFTRKDLMSFSRLFVNLFSLGLWCSLFLALIGSHKGGVWEAEYPGLLGYVFWNFLMGIFGYYAAISLLAIFFILLMCNFFNLSLYDVILQGYVKLKERCIEWVENRRRNEIIVKENIIDSQDGNNDQNVDLEKGEIKNDLELDDSFSMSEIVLDGGENEVDLDNDIEGEGIAIEEEIIVKEGDLDADEERRSKYREYKLPTLDFLNDPVELGGSYSEDDLKQKANNLIHALETYGVSGRVVRISPGPVITLFEIEPADGVRVNKFTNLSDDLARVMRAQRVRIIAPIPGSKSVGIELPNDNPSIVYLKNIINSEQFIQSKSKLTISLGKTTTGDAYVFDLGKMPHLLVAGATGAGKSVCINTMIVSILYKAKPDEVKFILMDPKKLELATYKTLVGYHLITAPNLDEYVMTTAENSVAILDSAIVEMERRFQVFADARVRNIAEYHDRRKHDDTMESVPFIVVIIDELADLMMTSGRAIEEPITRLAQKARAVGIHLIVATQRPSVDVITGLIKSNFPARIAFQVSSKIDSRTIIDQMGAEKLLGKGDMLFLLPGTASPLRLHNAYIELDEIEKIMTHIENQPKPEEIILPEVRKEKLEGEYSFDDDRDELLHDAAVMVVQNQQASVSLLQRKFRIGYSRAGRLIDELEAMGIVSGYSGSKAREVLVDESYLQNIFNE